LCIQIDGKQRGNVSVSVSVLSNSDELKCILFNTPFGDRWLKGREIERLIVIPDRKRISIVTSEKKNK
jgi:hypothetical protein